jgi:hypothetical protein
MDDLGRMLLLDMLLGNADRLALPPLNWRGNPSNVLFVDVTGEEDSPLYGRGCDDELLARVAALACLGVSFCRGRVWCRGRFHSGPDMAETDQCHACTILTCSRLHNPQILITERDPETNAVGQKLLIFVEGHLYLRMRSRACLLWYDLGACGRCCLALLLCIGKLEVQIQTTGRQHKQAVLWAFGGH